MMNWYLVKKGCIATGLPKIQTPCSLWEREGVRIQRRNLRLWGMKMEAGTKLMAENDWLDNAWWHEVCAKGNAGAGLAQQGRGQSQDPERKGW